MLNSHCVPWDEDCHLCNPTEHPVTAQPLTQEQEAEARRHVAEPMYQQPEPAVRYLAAALATVDELRGQNKALLNTWLATTEGQRELQRAIIESLDKAGRYVVSESDRAALDAAREGTP